MSNDLDKLECNRIYEWQCGDCDMFGSQTDRYTHGAEHTRSTGHQIRVTKTETFLLGPKTSDITVDGALRSLSERLLELVGGNPGLTTREASESLRANYTDVAFVRDYLEKKDLIVCKRVHTGQRGQPKIVLLPVSSSTV